MENAGPNEPASINVHLTGPRHALVTFFLNGTRLGAAPECKYHLITTSTTREQAAK
jgi:hypothetical protein